ncbi:MAG TPA: hypothetical protein VFA26_23765, partial [Gemmataceae bacterium]|nr:hypothetical protein [Gemmataceae bacterium]
DPKAVPTPAPPVATPLTPVPATPPLVGPPAPPGTHCPVDPPTPAVSIRVRVPACVDVGHELEYRLCVENCSRAAAHHVLVRNPLPANVRFARATPEPNVREPELQWQLGTLAPHACREIVLVVVPTAPGEVKDCARVQFEHGECVCTKVCAAPAAPPPPQAQITLKKCGPERATQFEALSYQLLVTNTGNAEATGVTLTDTLPDGLEHASGKHELTWDPFNLAPGQSRCFDYQVIAKRLGKLCNKATAAAGALRQEASHCVTVEPRIGLTKKGPERHSVRRPAEYQLTVINPGERPVTGLAVTDLLPAGTTFVSASDGGQLMGNRVQWSLGTLAAGASRTVTVELQAAAEGEVINQAEATADGGQSAKAEARTVFEGATGLTFDIKPDANIAPVGKPLPCRITVVNQGTQAATNVVIKVVLPPQVDFDSAAGPQDLKFQRKDNLVAFDALPTLPAQGQAMYLVTVKPKQAGGEVRFTAEMEAAELRSGAVRREAVVNVVPEGGNDKGEPPLLPKEGR